mgnify:CR=1 FL=1
MTESAKAYAIPSFGLLLRDAPEASLSDAERQFNDLFHLFLNRFARLTHDATLPADEAERLRRLLDDVIEARQKLDENQ